MKSLFTPMVAAAVAFPALLAAPAAHAVMPHYMQWHGFDGGYPSTAGSVGSFQWTRAHATPTFDPSHPGVAGGLGVAVGDLVGDGRFDLVRISASSTRGGPVIFEYMVFNAGVSAVDPQAAPGGGGTIEIESFSWGMSGTASHAIVYRPLLNDGSRGAPIRGEWRAGRFVGDAGVFQAFGELGATQLPDGSLVVTSAVPEPGTWVLALLGAGVLAARLRRREPALA